MDFLCRAAKCVGDHRETKRADAVDRLRMGRQRFALDALQIEHPDIQPACGGDSGILLPERARRRIARILERLLSGGLLLLGQPLKRRPRHIDLAAHLKQRRRVFQLQRNAPDRFEICGDILTDITVAARGTDRQDAVFVFQRHGKSVDFRLDRKDRICDVFADALHKGCNLLKREHVLEARHLYRMRDLFKFAGCHALYALCRGIRLQQVGKLRFQIAQLVHFHVVFVILGARRVQIIIFMRHAEKLFCQLPDTLCRFIMCHTVRLLFH